MPTDGLWPILAPVIVAALVLVVGSFASRRWAPAQAQTLAALTTRIAVLEHERDDCKAALRELTEEVTSLRHAVQRLTSDNYALLLDARDGGR